MLAHSEHITMSNTIGDNLDSEHHQRRDDTPGAIYEWTEDPTGLDEAALLTVDSRQRETAGKIVIPYQHDLVNEVMVINSSLRMSERWKPPRLGSVRLKGGHGPVFRRYFIVANNETSL